METWWAHFLPPSQAFKTSLRGCLCLHEWYKSYVRGLLVFQVTREYWSLSSSFLYTFFSARLTISRTEAFCHSTSLHPPQILAWPSSPGKLLWWYSRAPDPVAQVSYYDGTLGRHRLSSFLGSWGTLRPKGPLGRYLGDAPPSFRVFLSLCPAKRLGDDLFSRPAFASHSLQDQASLSHGTLPWPE